MVDIKVKPMSPVKPILEFLFQKVGWVYFTNKIDIFYSVTLINYESN